MTEIDIEQENKAIAKEYKELLRISYQTLTAEDKKIIRKAFDVAVRRPQRPTTQIRRGVYFSPNCCCKNC